MSKFECVCSTLPSLLLLQRDFSRSIFKVIIAADLLTVVSLDVAHVPALNVLSTI